MRSDPVNSPKCLLRSAALVFVLLIGVAGNAAALMLTATSSQTEDGQQFDFEFDPAPLSNGTDGFLTIHARGDYQPGNPFEFLTWDIDTLGIGTTGPIVGEATILQNNGPNDVEWIQSWDILGEDMLSATADGVLAIGVDLNLDELFRGVNHFANTEFVTVSLVYPPLPEPSSALLFLVGGAAIRSRLRRGSATR